MATIAVASAPEKSRDLLRELALRDSQLFHDLFWRGRQVPASPLLHHLKGGPLLSSRGCRFRATVQVWRDGGTIIVTDRPDLRAENRVFPVFPDESLSLVAATRGRLGRVLDLGTGSGVLAAAVAHRAESVTAIDINPRSIRFAAANIMMNGLGQRISVRRGDLFAPVHGRRFDTVLANPPFVPVPPGASFHLAGNGGAEGTRVIERVLRGVASVLAPSGRLFMSCLSLERDGEPHALALARQALPGDMSVRIGRLYPDSVPLCEFTRLFRRHDLGGAWATRLRRSGFTSLGFFLLVASRSDASPSLAPTPRPLPTAFRPSMSGGWQQRFGRYQLWLGAS